MGFAGPNEFGNGFGGITPHTHHQGSYQPSIGGGIALDGDSDIDGVNGGIESDGGGHMEHFDIDLDNGSYFFGHGKTAVATHK